MIDAIKTISAALSSATEATATTGASSAQSMMGGASAVSGGQSFASVMTDMAGEMTNSLKTAETASIQGIRGEANTREVIDAVMHAEQSLQTAIAIRDKVVTAFLDITRMQI